MEVVRIMKVLTNAQRQQIAINKKYAVNIQTEEIEKTKKR